MAFDWLYGAKTGRHPSNGALTVRSSEYDLEDVIDLGRFILQLLGPTATTPDEYYVRWSVQDPYAGETEKTESELAGLGSVDRSRLRLEIRDMTAPKVDVRFTSKDWTTVGVHVGDAAFRDEVEGKVGKFLLEHGSPIPQTRPLLRFVPPIVAAGLVGCVLAATISGAFRPLVAVIAWLFTGFAVAAAVVSYRAVVRKYAYRVTGPRIRLQSRMETAATRADRHANARLLWKALPPTVLGGVIVGVVVGWLLFVLQLKT